MTIFANTQLPLIHAVFLFSIHGENLGYVMQYAYMGDWNTVFMALFQMSSLFAIYIKDRPNIEDVKAQWNALDTKKKLRKLRRKPSPDVFIVRNESANQKGCRKTK